MIPPGILPGFAGYSHGSTNDMIARMPESIAATSCEGFLAALASTQPVPGGGAVAGVVGATSAALGEMVAGYSLGRSDDASIEESIKGFASELAKARVLFLQLADEDAAAYVVLNAAFKLPKSDPARADSIRAGAKTAVQPPLAVLATSGDVSRILEGLLPISNKNLRSDLAIAARLTASTASAAMWNIRANTPLLGDAGVGVLAEAQAIADAIESRCGSIESDCRVG